MTTMRRIGLGMALLSAPAACEREHPAETAVVLTLESDLGQALQGAWLRIYAADADLVRSADRPVSELQILSPAGLAQPIVIRKQHADGFLVLVRGFGAGGPSDTLVEYAVRGHFVEGAMMAMPVYLAERCANKSCDTAQGMTCYGESHGEVCEGSCGPIYEHDTMFEVEREGDERSTSWHARACLDGGRAGDRGDDASDGRADADAHLNIRDGGPPDANPGAPDAGCETVSLEDVCSLANRCGCAQGTSCTPGDARGDSEIEVSCEVHDVALAGSCDADLDCPDWHVCLGDPLVGSACYPLCGGNAACGPSGRCIPIRNDDNKPIEGLAACFQQCTQDSDCPTLCCGSDNTCAPAGYCAKCQGGACSCKADFQSGCERDQDCCGSGGLPGHCQTTTSDGGVKTMCVSQCSNTSQCGSGRCCVSGACWPRDAVEQVAAEEGLDPALFCML